MLNNFRSASLSITLSINTTGQKTTSDNEPTNSISTPETSERPANARPRNREGEFLFYLLLFLQLFEILISCFSNFEFAVLFAPFIAC